MSDESNLQIPSLSEQFQRNPEVFALGAVFLLLVILSVAFVMWRNSRERGMRRRSPGLVASLREQKKSLQNDFRQVFAPPAEAVKREHRPLGDKLPPLRGETMARAVMPSRPPTEA
jgi:hypothetical protein